VAPGNDDSVGLALRCIDCGTASVSALFYLGADAHVCRACGAPFELVDHNRDRRSGAERRVDERNAAEWAEWRSGEDRRRSLSMEPRRRLQTPSAG
jgi:hypothetical protein